MPETPDIFALGAPRKPEDLYAEAAPQYPVTRDEEQAQILAQVEARPKTYYEAIGHAANLDWFIPNALRWAEKVPYAWTGDPDYVASDELTKKLREGLDPIFWKKLDEARSEEEGWVIRDQMLLIQASEQKLSAIGGTPAVIARILANAVDPAQMAIDAATAITVPPMSATQGANRLRRMLRSGIVAAAANSPIVAFNTTQNPAISFTDVAASAVGAFALTAAGRGIADVIEPKLAARRMANIQRASDRLAAQAAVEEGMTITPKGQQKLHVERMGEPWPETEAKKMLDAMNSDLSGIPTERMMDAEELVDDLGKEPYRWRNLDKNWHIPEQEAWKTGSEPDLMFYLRESGISDKRIAMMTPQTRLRLSNDIVAIQELAASDVASERAASTLIGKFEAIADSAANRLAKRNKGMRLLAGLPADDMADAVIYGTAKLAAGTLKFEAWAEVMVAKFGTSVEDHLDEIWRASQTAFLKSMPRAAYRSLIPESIKDAPEGAPVLAKGSWAQRLMEKTGRYSMGGAGEAAEYAPMRKLFRELGWHFPDAEGNAAAMSGTEFVRHATQREALELYDEINPKVEAYIAARKPGVLKRELVRDELFERAGIAVRDTTGRIETDADVLEIAQGYRKSFFRMFKDAQEAKLPGFTETADNPFYVPRIHNPQRYLNAIHSVGEDNIRKLLNGARRAAGTDLTDEQIDIISRATIRNTLRRQIAPDLPNAKALGGDSAERLTELLQEADVPADQIEQIIYQATTKGEGKKIARAKERLRLDETFAMTFDTPEGPKTVRVTDLLENNVDVLHSMYAKQIYSSIAERKILESFAKPDEDAVPSFDVLLKRMRNEISDNRDKYSKRFVEKTAPKLLSYLETMHSALMGKPIGDASPALRKWINRLGQFNTLRLGGKFGFAQLPEFGNVLAEGTLVKLSDAMPALKDAIESAVKGKITNEQLREIMLATGGGHGLIARTQSARYADLAGGQLTALGQTDRAMDAITRAHGKLTGLHYIDSAQRAWAANIMGMNLAEHAFQKRAPAKNRLRMIGMSDAMWDKVSAQIRKRSTHHINEAGQKYRLLNLDKWEDADAAAHLVIGITKAANVGIQENNVANLSQWMTKPVAQALLQFRGFSLNAHRMQLMRGAYQADMTTALSWSYQIFLGSMTYIGLQYANSLGREDRAAFLSERLTMSEIAKGAFQRAGWSAITPGAVDTVLALGTFKPAFAYGRTSNLDTNILTGSPTYDLLARKLPGLVRSGAGTLLNPNYSFSRDDYRNIKGTLMFNNMLGVESALNMFGTSLNLPKKSVQPEGRP